MPYGLFTPSSINEYENIPLIVWLHGGGEVYVDSEVFKNRGLPKTLHNWELEGFNAYVICPHLKSPYNYGRWNREPAQVALKELLDDFIGSHNVDRNKIIISGHSLGGQGALYMAQTMPDYFSALVPLSPYNPYIEITNFDIPVKSYVGSLKNGEDIDSVNYALSLAKIYGKKAIKNVKASHGLVPYKAFNLDYDKNNQSDLIEWMLEQ